jgi:hypothetical protein
MKDKLLQVARNIAEASGGRVRLAFQEDCESRDHIASAAHFLKLDERRLGRDIEIYGFMAKVQGNQGALVEFVEEVVLPLRQIPDTYDVAVAAMKALGREIYPADMIQEWDALFA